jgi:4-hydroxybenzoate polyprenyltransferase
VLLAGGPPAIALRLGVAMFALQAAIGTANDLVDESRDRGRKAAKPLPAGLLSRRAAAVVLIAGVAVGLGLSALSGPVVLLIAVVGLAIGLAYDVWFKGTVWSWLPWALGLPLLPVYAWLGAIDRLPAAFVVLIPAAVLAGAALALANLRADMERDRSAGGDTAATRLGADRAWLLNVALQASVATIAMASLVAVGAGGWGVALAVAGLVVVVAGLAFGRRGPPLVRERSWEIQAVGTALLAAGWVAALAEAGALRA